MFSVIICVNLSEKLGSLAISIIKTVEQRLPFEQAWCVLSYQFSDNDRCQVTCRYHTGTKYAVIWKVKVVFHVLQKSFCRSLSGFQIHIFRIRLWN